MKTVLIIRPHRVNNFVSMDKHANFLEEFFLNEGYELNPLCSKLKSFKITRGSRLKRFFHNYVSLPTYLIFSGRNDIVVNVDQSFSFYILFVRCRKSICFVHDIIYLTSSPNSKIKKFFRKIRFDFIRFFNLVIAVSNHTKNEVISSGLVGKEKKIHILHMCLLGNRKHTERKNRDELITILSVGSWGENKNLSTLIDLIPGLLAENQYRVVRVGDFLPEHIVEAYSNLPNAELIEHGRVSERKLGEVYMSSDFLYFPSTQEGFGLPVIEAAAFDVIPICSDIPILREVASDFAHYFPLEDPELAIKIMNDLIADKERFSEAIINLKIAREKYSKERYYRSFNKILNDHNT